jgi:hypothetical protein
VHSTLGDQPPFIVGVTTPDEQPSRLQVDLERARQDSNLRPSDS